MEREATLRTTCTVSEQFRGFFIEAGAGGGDVHVRDCRRIYTGQLCPDGKSLLNHRSAAPPVPAAVTLRLT